MLQLRRLSNGRGLRNLICAIGVICGQFFSMAALPLAGQSIAWQFAGPPAGPGRVVSVVADSRNNGVEYFVAPGAGIWKTPDSGNTWIPLTDSTPTLQYCSLTLDPFTPDVIYAGIGDDQSPRTSQGVTRSPDGGATWTTRAIFTNQPVCALAVDSSNTSRIAAGSLEGTFVSLDKGSTWTKMLPSPTTSVAFDGQGNLYSGVLVDTSSGVRTSLLTRSGDGGKTWSNILLPDNPAAGFGSQTGWVNVIANGNTLAVLIAYQNTAFYPGSATAIQSPFSQLDFYGSLDGGNTWLDTFGIGQARPPAEIVIDPATGNYYIAGKTLLSSTNLGASWQTVATTASDFHSGVITTGVLLLGGEKGLQAVALPGFTAPSITSPPISQILQATLDLAGTIWGAGPAGLFGMQAGVHFQENGVPGIGPVGAVVTASAGSGNIYTSGLTQVYDSGNHGTTFAAHTAIPAGELRAPFPPLLMDPTSPSSSYVAGQKLYHTSDSGTTWTALGTIDPDPTHVVTALARSSGFGVAMYAATACLPEVVGASCPSISLIWRSTTNGSSWTQLNPVSGYVSALAVDPRQTATIYAAVGTFTGGASLAAGLTHGDILQSANAQAWTSIRGNLPATPVNAIAIDPNSVSTTSFLLPAQTMYIATDTGVYVCFNISNSGGELWTSLAGAGSVSLPPSPVTDIVLESNGTLLASTFGRGIYTSATTGLTVGVIANPLSLDASLFQGTTTTIGLILTNPSTHISTWSLTASDPWISLPESTGSMPSLTSSPIPLYISAAGLALGSYTSRLQLTSGSFIQNIVVNVQVTPTPANISIVGNSQLSGLSGSVLPPLQVQVTDSNQQPLPGVTVAFAVTAGGGTLSLRNAETDLNGVASTTLTLPSTAGAVSVIATVLNLSATFTISVRSIPSLQADSVLDAATMNLHSALGPGSIVAILGQNFASATAVALSTGLPNTLGNISALLTTAGGDTALPLLSVSPQQVLALLPFNILPGTYPLRLQIGSANTNAVQITVAAYDPGIFTTNGTGHGPGIFLKSDGSIVTAANPAVRGSSVTFYAAGLGAVNPAISAGQPGATKAPFNLTARTPRVVFDTYQATVSYSGLAPGVAGHYQVTVTVPALLTPSNSVSVSFTIGSFASNRVTIPVQ
jgi:uncharacterized protein (TIGR03437 family)